MKFNFLQFINFFLVSYCIVTTPSNLRFIYDVYYHQNFNYQNNGYSCIQGSIFIIHVITYASPQEVKNEITFLQNQFSGYREKDFMGSYKELANYDQMEGPFKIEEFNAAQNIKLNGFIQQINNEKINNENVFYLFMIGRHNHPVSHFFIIQYFRSEIYIFQSYQEVYTLQASLHHQKHFLPDRFIDLLKDYLSDNVQTKTNAITELFCYINTNCNQVIHDLFFHYPFGTIIHTKPFIYYHNLKKYHYRPIILLTPTQEFANIPNSHYTFRQIFLQKKAKRKKKHKKKKNKNSVQDL